MIYSELNVNDLANVADELVSHRTNKIEEALQKHLLKATPELIEKDVNRMGIIQCKGCGLWWWEDQMTDGYCKALCSREEK